MNESVAYNVDESELVEWYSSPMSVPVSPDETESEREGRWKKFDVLSGTAKDVLASDETDQTIIRLRDRHGLTIPQMAYLARAVRLYFFEELSLADFPDYFVRNMGVTRQIATDMADVLARRVIQKPFDDTRRQMPLTAALDQMHDLKDQIITEGGVVVAGANIRMRGTIENWITDYHLAIGQGRHNAVERGNYLFHNRNTRPLTAVDRQRLAIVLKSLDEDVPLTVDTARGTIVFPVAQPIPQRDGVVPPQRPVVSSPALAAMPSSVAQDAVQPAPAVSDDGPQPAGYARFSSGHRLPVERDRLQPGA